MTVQSLEVEGLDHFALSFCGRAERLERERRAVIIWKDQFSGRILALGRKSQETIRPSLPQGNCTLNLTLEVGHKSAFPAALDIRWVVVTDNNCQNSESIHLARGRKSFRSPSTSCCSRPLEKSRSVDLIHAVFEYNHPLTKEVPIVG